MHGAVVGLQEAGQHPEQGRLAGAVGAHQAHALPLGDGQVRAPQDELIGKGDLDALGPEDHLCNHQRATTR